MLIGERHSYRLDLTIIAKDFGKGQTQSDVLGAVAQVHILDLANPKLRRQLAK
jgi:hypothetical protein